MMTLRPRQDIREAIKTGLPIFIGYLPPAIAFGILSKSLGIGFWETALFSAALFAGASQFIALNLLSAGMGYGGVILTTFLVNFRHFLMSASLSARMGKMAGKHRLFMAFGITDEVFSVLSFTRRELTPAFVFTLEFFAYSGWVAGTLAGFIMEGLLPETLSQSMGIALYALLLTILLPEMKTSVKAVLLVVASGALNTFLIRMDILPNGWNIIVCIIVIAFTGSCFPVKGKARRNQEEKGRS